MYGGLARAMQETNANSFRLFAIKNDLDQQRLLQVQQDRQNQIQDRGLLRADEAWNQGQQDRLRNQRIQDRGLLRADEAWTQGQNDRLRNQKREDTQDVQRAGLLTEQTKDREAARAKTIREEGLHRLAQEMLLNNAASEQTVAEVSQTGTIRFKQGAGSAVYDPKADKVRLTLETGQVIEKPGRDFFNAILGSQKGFADSGKVTRQDVDSALAILSKTNDRGELLFTEGPAFDASHSVLKRWGNQQQDGPEGEDRQSAEDFLNQ
jgi:hypothetical protein